MVESRRYLEICTHRACAHALTQETTIISYAHIAVELFQLEVPQRIGTLSRGSGKDTLAVVPRIGAPPAHSADKVFDSLEAFVGYLFASARDVAFAIETSEAEPLLAGLEKRAKRVIAGLPKRALRCVLMKDGLAESSVFVDERTGVVTSIVDWDAHSVVPRCLAAEYPSWLRYDGVHDPAFARGAKWWIESPAESARLNHLFEQVCTETVCANVTGLNASRRSSGASQRSFTKHSPLAENSVRSSSGSPSLSRENPPASGCASGCAPSGYCETACGHRLSFLEGQCTVFGAYPFQRRRR